MKNLTANNNAYIFGFKIIIELIVCISPFIFNYNFELMSSFIDLQEAEGKVSKKGGLI